MSYDVDVLIIGAGVIGLAIASQMAGENREVYILKLSKISLSAMRKGGV
jgi:L-2-hydroxyglutarate oxidase LhgO